MAIQRIFTRNDLPNYSQRVELDGSIFILSFRYSLRPDRWFLDVQDEQENDLIMGIPLQTGVGLIGRFRVPGQPENEFLVFNREGTNDNPGRDELGVSHQLLYNEADE
jgi:hypothetical protein